MANVLTGGIGPDDEAYQRRLRRSLMDGSPMVRRHAPTVEHPFGREEIIPRNEWANDPLVQPGLMQQAIDYEQMERARREMMDQHTNTGVRGMNTHARGIRITDYEFRKELSHRLEQSHPLLLNWAMGESDSENVDLWEIIVVCAIDQMLHGTPTQEPTQIDIMNAELKKLEEDKHGTPMAE